MFEATLGWIGTVGTFAAYVLVVQGRIEARSNFYLLVNASGGLLVGVANVFYGAWPSVASNFLWVAVSVYPMVAAATRRVFARDPHAPAVVDVPNDREPTREDRLPVGVSALD